MQPLFLGYSSYFLAWLLSAGVCITAALISARRSEFALFPSLVAIVSAGVLLILGSKLLYLAESLTFPLNDYVPAYARGPLHGFRIPGGILLLACVFPLYVRLLGLPRGEFGDAVIPWLALSVVLVRVGCFLNGCCFGVPSSLPWAVSFPSNSWVFWYHRYHEWIPAGSTSSLPVHPLQLYFLSASGLLFVILILLQQRRLRPGTLQLFFYASFFASTALLEVLRQNQLTLNRWVTTVAAVVLSAALVIRIMRATTQSVSLVNGRLDPL